MNNRHNCHPSAACALMLAVASSLVAQQAAQAAATSPTAYSYYTQRDVNSGDYVNYSPDYKVTNYGSLTDYNGAPLEYEWAGTHTWSIGNGKGGYVVRAETSDVYAKADLSTGELKARASVGTGYNLPGSSSSNPALGYVGTAASAKAAFADTIHFSNAGGSPYLWQNGGQLTFHLALDGTITSPNGYAAPADPTYGRGINGALVTLEVYKAGQGFSSMQTYQNFASTMNWSKQSDMDHLNLLWEDVLNAKLGTQYWAVTNSSLPDSWQQYYTVVPLGNAGGISLDYSVAAAGDIEFVLGLEAIASVDEAYEGVTNSVDFSHTLHTSIVKPNDAIMSSASGQFLVNASPTTQVPEPSTWGMALSGLAAFALVGSRRKWRD